MQDPVHCGCGHTIAVKPEWTGKSIRCTSCQAILIVPGGEMAPETAPKAAETPVSSKKACPYCSETIQAAAIKCRHCGELLGKAGGDTASRPPRPPPQDTGGIGALVVGILAWVFCAFFILHPIAWFMGHAYERDCRSRGVEPSGAGKAGKVLGMVGTLLSAIGLLFFIFALLAGGLN